MGQIDPLGRGDDGGPETDVQDSDELDRPDDNRDRSLYNNDICQSPGYHHGHYQFRCHGRRPAQCPNRASGRYLLSHSIRGSVGCRQPVCYAPASTRFPVPPGRISTLLGDVPLPVPPYVPSMAALSVEGALAAVNTPLSASGTEQCPTSTPVEPAPDAPGIRPEPP